MTLSAPCAFCGFAVYDPHVDAGGRPAHPCCAWWIGEQGYDRCYSCIQARSKGRSPIRIPRHPPARRAKGAAA